MKKDLQLVNKARDKMLNVAVQLDDVSEDLRKLNNALIDMRIVRQAIVENIQILKMSHTVPMVCVYKELVGRLANADAKITKWEQGKSILLSIKKDRIEQYKHSVKHYQTLKKEVEQQKVVLAFDPTKRKERNSNDS